MSFLHLLFLALLLPTTIALAQTYKWVDQDGVVSYSQTPPASAEAETLILKHQPQSKSTEANTELDRLRQQLDDRREDRQLAKETERKEKEALAIKQKNCNAARSNLRKLKTSGIRMLKTSDGKHLRLTESERQERIQTARDQVEANCNR